ncbi:hypothetical protein H312_03242 [Anncaliia algerae PRA339]|uniref:Palmitoyltransferase n=1 Tax=Anncaliia algerae PRA339 TaxID=1288291 RepID=A0A059EWF0_9MICR|nr:hypothetical protein H312_03242 [Anncaliia algerae PRA339]
MRKKNIMNKRNILCFLYLLFLAFYNSRYICGLDLKRRNKILLCILLFVFAMFVYYMFALILFYKGKTKHHSHFYNRYDNEFRFCKVCKIIMNKRVNHCYKCDACIKRRDYHSILIDMCINQDNLPYFMRFLVLSSLFNLITLMINLNRLSVSLSEKISERVNYNLTMLFALQNLFLFNFFMYLFKFHLKLILYNLTTEEYLHIQETSSRKYLLTDNPYNRGKIRNLFLFLGKPYFLFMYGEEKYYDSNIFLTMMQSDWPLFRHKPRNVLYYY